jgi:hypothetical protein
VLEALSHFRAELDALTRAIETGNADALRAALSPAQARRSTLFR